MQADFLDAMFTVKGLRRPGALGEDVLGFLRQRSVDQGKNPEEVDALLASMDTGSAAAASHIAQPSSKES